MRILPAAALALALVGTPGLGQESAPDPVPGVGVKPVSVAGFTKAWALPDVDFQRYARIVILEPFVDFKKDWRRDHQRVSNADMETMKQELAALFLERFDEVLGNSGFEITTDAGADVLVIRPALIDLDVNVPNAETAGPDKQYATSALTVTLYMELVDSTSGRLQARVIDRDRTTQNTLLELASSVYNVAEARKLLNVWAGQLRDWLKGG